MILASLRISLLFMVVCGLLYNLAVTGIAQAIMPDKANGTLLYDANDKVVGSALIGQNFPDPSLFQSRVSSIGYNAAGSGSTNYAPSNPDMLVRTEEAIRAWGEQNPDVPVRELPIDLITNSGSGLDPHISPEAARVQIPRISLLTGIGQETLAELVERHTSGRALGFLGEPVVHVLKLNLDVIELMKSS